MATLRDIKRRINAVKNTRQITKAMKMVAAAKLRKAQLRMLQMRPYAERMNEVLGALSATADTEIHPLLASRPRKTIELIVITSNRGLCGAFNSNILKAASRFIKERKEQGFNNINISVIGKKARDYFKRRNIEIRKSWIGLSGNLTYSEAQEIANEIINSYLDHVMDEVIILYNRFKTVMTQEVTSFRLLPYALPESHEEKTEVTSSVFIFEPSQEEIYNQLLPKNIEIQIYSALLESQASEEAARMTAMENATKNADDMIDNLTLQFNKARQATITKELMDIVGGVEALK
jgi:F-type H+-transporting ATPase subunit gamma